MNELRKMERGNYYTLKQIKIYSEPGVQFNIRIGYMTRYQLSRFPKVGRTPACVKTRYLRHDAKKGAQLKRMRL
jgi:hypothetical protein